MVRQWSELGVTDGSAWDHALACARDGTIFQTVGWGEHRRTSGWTPQRWMLREDGRVLGLAQVLRRPGPPGIPVAWCPGGPVVGLGEPDPEEAARRLCEFVAAQRAPGYLRFDSYLPSDRTLSNALRGVAARPRRRVNTGVTTTLDLTRSHDELLARMKHKHRYNLRHALDLPIVWRRGCIEEASSLARIYGDMVAAKGLRARRRPTDVDIADLCERLGGRARILVGAIDGRDVVGCLVLIHADRALLHMPATARRSAGLSYAMIDVLIRDLRDIGVRTLDLAGVDPTGRAAGVNRFKLGFGGPTVERLGEWEWADPSILRLAVEIALRVRGPVLG